MTILLQGAGIQAVTSAPAGPQFSSAEIGTVNASTLVVTFDQDVTADENDYGLGVTIKVNGVSTSISGGIRQTNHAVVYYGIPVLWHGSGDTVTWEYNSATGIIVAESGGAALGDVTAQNVTNNCEYAGILNLQADTLALNDGDPVSTWSDQSGQSHDATAAGATITKQTDLDGKIYILFPAGSLSYFDDGTGTWCNNLDSFSIFAVSVSQTVIISKMDNTSSGAGWALYAQGGTIIIQEDGGSNWIEIDASGNVPTVKFVSTAEIISKSNVHLYIDGVDRSTDASSPPVNDYSSTDHILIGAFGNHLTWGGNLYAVMICAPAPNATNRAALETRLGARYGLVVP